MSPLNPIHEQSGASFMPYGPPDDPIRIVAALTHIETEYAAIRKGCAILDQPFRGVLEARGGERLDFLNRMITQKVADLAPLHARRAFWLNRKGRIDADLRLINLEDRSLADLDVLCAATAQRTLTEFLFAEDVQIEDESERTHRLALHGPQAGALLAGRAERVAGPRPDELNEGEACLLRIAGVEVVVDRQDATGSVGLELTMPADAAPDVYRALAAPVEPPGPDRRPPRPEDAARIGARPIGWHAYNIARIESGWPLFNVDFGPTNLPHETGVLRDRVCFTKGCYLGQEIVARMESLGRPKQVLVGLKVEIGDEPLQPATGSRVLSGTGEDADTLGAVTSSTLSPMLGAAPVCFAMVKQAAATSGTRLHVEAEGRVVPATVQEGLRFWGP